MHSVLTDVLSHCSVCVYPTYDSASSMDEKGQFQWRVHSSTLLSFKIIEFPLHVFLFSTRLYAWVWWRGQQYHNIQFVYGNLLLKHQILVHCIVICNDLHQWSLLINQSNAKIPNKLCNIFIWLNIQNIRCFKNVKRPLREHSIFCKQHSKTSNI